nr:mediator of RNA polymerase II transcription subunit 11 isoform X1 [Gorilla gorilla gorilla]
MATYSLANERLRALEDIEREIGAILQNAGTVILELSKEKTNERLLDRQAAAFTASVQHVEAELSAQIRYLTQVATGQPHEGSSYSSRKDCQMALKRVDYARLKLSDVARTSGCSCSALQKHPDRLREEMETDIPNPLPQTLHAAAPGFPQTWPNEDTYFFIQRDKTRTRVLIIIKAITIKTRSDSHWGRQGTEEVKPTRMVSQHSAC